MGCHALTDQTQSKLNCSARIWLLGQNPSDSEDEWVACMPGQAHDRMVKCRQVVSRILPWYMACYSSRCAAHKQIRDKECSPTEHPLPDFVRGQYLKVVDCRREKNNEDSDHHFADHLNLAFVQL